MKRPDTIMIEGRAYSWQWILELRRAHRRRAVSGTDLAGAVAERGEMVGVAI